MILSTVFWLGLGLIVYCYFGYPVLIFLAARLRPRPVNKSFQEPAVSLVMSVYNEEDVIERKLRNLLALDYPKHKMEILVGSDASTDKTDAIIRRFAPGGVRLIRMPRRGGKMRVINHLVEQAKHDIIIGLDARQVLAPDAVTHLVANFSDARVGCVSGELMFGLPDKTVSTQSATSRGVRMYWDYEKFIRRQESAVHSTLGATGALYAFRKGLFAAIPPDIVLDDVYVPLRIIQQGYRVVFDERAKAYDQPARDSREEYRRKIRTLFGNFQIFQIFWPLFNPLKSPVAIQFFSHKFLRVIIPFLMIGVFFTNMALMASSFYHFFFILQCLFYIMAYLGSLAGLKKYDILRPLWRLCSIPYVFVVLNFSALMGFWRFVRGKQKVTWDKARSTK